MFKSLNKTEIGSPDVSVVNKRPQQRFDLGCRVQFRMSPSMPFKFQGVVDNCVFDTQAKQWTYHIHGSSTSTISKQVPEANVRQVDDSGAPIASKEAANVKLIESLLPKKQHLRQSNSKDYTASRNSGQKITIHEAAVGNASTAVHCPTASDREESVPPGPVTQLDQELANALLDSPQVVKLLYRLVLKIADGHDISLKSLVMLLKRLGLNVHTKRSTRLGSLVAQYIVRGAERLANTICRALFVSPDEPDHFKDWYKIRARLLKHWYENAEQQENAKQFESPQDDDEKRLESQYQQMLEAAEIFNSEQARQEMTTGQAQKADGSYAIENATAEAIASFTEPYNVARHVVSAGVLSSFGADVDRHIRQDTMLRIREFITFSPTPLSLEDYLCGISRAFFDVRWGAKEFLEQELEPGASLRSFIVLTGTSSMAWASTIEEYVSVVWPKTGARLLNCVEMFLCAGCTPGGRVAEIERSKSECEFSIVEGSSASNLRLSVQGIREEVIEIGQQLTWLTSVLRVSKNISKKRSSLTYSRANFESVGFQEIEANFGSIELRRNEGKTKNVVVYREYRISPAKLIDVPFVSSACWHSLFPNRVLAQGFSVPKRCGMIGVEISFELMTYLAFSLYPLSWHDGTILVGDDNILIPVSRSGDNVQWHLVKSYQGSSLNILHENNLPEPVDISYEAMSVSRNFLGFCENAEIHLGTQNPARSSLKASGAQEDKTGIQFSRELSFQLTTSSPAIIGGQFGFKANLPRRQALHTPFSDINLDQALWNTKDQTTLVYDNGASIGWLVPEASVILHLTHEWLATRDDIPESVRNAFPCADACGGGSAALEAIISGLDLLIYPAARSIQGVPLYFRDLVKNMLRQFYSRKQLAVAQNQALDSQNLFQKIFSSSTLRGWDALDIILDKPWVERRKVEIDQKKAGHWNGITFRNPELLVLLCSNLEAPIRPNPGSVCNFWRSIPAGSYYLIASLECLRNLGVAKSSTNRNGKEPKYIWNQPHGHMVFKGCDHRNRSVCNRLQELVTRDAQHPSIPDDGWHGAIAFGKVLGDHKLQAQEKSAGGTSCPNELAIEEVKIYHPSSDVSEDILSPARTARTR